MNSTDRTPAVTESNIKPFPAPKRELSSKAKLVKDALAALAACCDEIKMVSRTSKTSEQFFQGTIAMSIQGLLMLSSAEVYRELFGEYPQNTDSTKESC